MSAPAFNSVVIILEFWLNLATYIRAVQPYLS
jgi:hypothetical protein